MKLNELPWQLSDPYEQVGAAFESVVRRMCSIRSGCSDQTSQGVGVYVKVADSNADQLAADRLIAERYAWRGYVDQSGTSEISTGTRLSCFTLLALRNDNAVGTLTLGIDGSSGLAVDDANQEVVDGLRRIGRHVVELRKFAVLDDGQSKTILANLFLAAYKIGRLLHRATDVLIEINPRHEAYYRRIFGFARIGREWVCPRVNAPAVLMHLDLTNLDAKLRASH
jgi:N-acyl amino acid synthase FeeM